MTAVLSTMITAFLTAPLFGYFVFYCISRAVVKNNKTAVHFAADCSTFLFIAAVHFTLVVIFGKSFLWYIVLVMIVISSIFVFLHWKLKGEIHFGKVFKGIWRFHFLIFIFAYLILTLYGVIESAVTYAS